MKKISFALAIALSFGLWSCDKTTEGSVTDQEVKIHDEHAEHAEHAEDHAHHDHETIEFDNGSKWAVNDEMKPNVQKAEETLKSYLASGSDDHKALVADLEKINVDLIESCTMEGKSHDELHKWLHPYIELLKALKATDDKEEVKELTNDLVRSFDTYHRHFE